MSSQIGLEEHLLRKTLTEAVDAAVEEFVKNRTGRGEVWRRPPSRRIHDEWTPRGEGRGIEAAVRLALRDVLPFGVGNVSPRFLGWVHGSQSPTSLPAAVIAAALNANTGGRNHAAVHVEKTIIEWCLSIFGLSESGSGVFTSGTSEGNLLGLFLAREHWRSQTSENLRGDIGRPAVVVSEATHDSVHRALRLLDLEVVLAPSWIDGTFDLERLQDVLLAARRDNLEAVALVATAGYIDSGRCDDIAALAEIAKDAQVWLHLDAAFGAWLKIAGPQHAHYVHGTDAVDSLAFDFHKWLPVPFAVGALLVRDRDSHLGKFGIRSSYLGSFGDGISGADPWAVDLGFALSRGTSSLIAALVLIAEGIDSIGRGIARCMDLAIEFAQSAPNFGFETVHSEFTNVVLLRPSCKRCAGDSSQVARIANGLAEGGWGVVSTTQFDGQLVLRACFVNHYTQSLDVRIVLEHLRVEHLQICPTVPEDA